MYQYFGKYRSKTFSSLFYKQPEPFSRLDKQSLVHGLGATLYMPATKDNLDEIISNTLAGSVVLCLEDAIGESEQLKGIYQIQQLFLDLETNNREKIPLIFIRPRNKRQVTAILDAIGDYHKYLCGFSLPKFDSISGGEILALIDDKSKELGKPFYAMPILESNRILSLKTRYQELEALENLFKRYHSTILNIRIGSTDMAGLYGLRRVQNITIWENSLVSSLIGDIVNYFGNNENLAISGTVWEHYVPKNELEDIFKHPSMINLLKELELDKANGLLGKTVIHPTQIPVVLANMVVSHNDYLDALSIIKDNDGGVTASFSGDRMNEMKPHLFWAEKIIFRANIYGVANKNVTIIDIWKKIIEENRVEIINYCKKNVAL